MVDENSQEKFLLTQKVDKITGSQMKEMEVMKMEDGLTIKMLEREYLEKKRNFSYSQKKLEEARKKSSTQSEIVNQLELASKALVEKFQELKRFQNEVILVNVNNAEKSSIARKNKNIELLKSLQLMTKQENYSKRLNKEILEKQNILNSDVKKQIDERKQVSNNVNVTSIQLKEEFDMLQKKLRQEEADNQLDKNVEEKTNRIIQLEADEEVFQNQFKQDIDDLTKKINNQLQDLENNKKISEDRKATLLKLESELLSIEKNRIKKNEDLEKLLAKKENILKEVMAKRETKEYSKKEFEENIKKLKDELDKSTTELQTLYSKFTKTEDDLHTQLKSSMGKYDEKKKLLKKLDNYQNNFTKLKELKIKKQKELFNYDKELQDKLKKITEELEKQEQIYLTNNKKQSELDQKIKELQDKRNISKEELERVDEIQTNVVNNEPKISEVELKSSQLAKGTQLTSPQKKTIYSTDKNELDVSDANKRSLQTPKKVSPAVNSQKKSIYSMELDDSEESDDEFSIKNIAAIKSGELAATPHKKPIYNSNRDDDNIEKNFEHKSQSEQLFDVLLTHTPSSSPKNAKDTDVFKIPQTYTTPIRKKYTQSKKY